MGLGPSWVCQKHLPRAEFVWTSMHSGCHTSTCFRMLFSEMIIVMLTTIWSDRLGTLIPETSWCTMG